MPVLNPVEWHLCKSSAAMISWLGGGERMTDRQMLLFACACAREISRYDMLGSHILASVKYQELLADDPHSKDLRFPTPIPPAYSHESWGETPLGCALWWACEKCLDGLSKAMILRDVVCHPLVQHRVACQSCKGNPPRPFGMCYACDGRGWHYATGPDPAWITPLTVSLAQDAYEHQNDFGHLEETRLSVLADAIEDVGCSETACPVCDGDGGCTDLFRCSNGRVIHPLIAHLRGWVALPVPSRSWVVFMPPPYGMGLPHYRGCWAVDTIRLASGGA